MNFMTRVKRALVNQVVTIACALAVVTVALPFLKSGAQPASSRQPREMQYAFPVYPTLAALLADGPVPLQYGMVILRGGSTTNYDGNGSILLWNSAALTATNANTVFAQPGITNSAGTLVGRWFALNDAIKPVP